MRASDPVQEGVGAHGLGFGVNGEGDKLGEVPRGEKMFLSGTDPESYITEYTLAYYDFAGSACVFADSVRQEFLIKK